ncbi:hypothetical protein N9L68_02340 [bacterium]|nr:hypothetical protein [bacterium]
MRTRELRAAAGRRSPRSQQTAQFWPQHSLAVSAIGLAQAVVEHFDTMFVATNLISFDVTSSS